MQNKQVKIVLLAAGGIIVIAALVGLGIGLLIGDENQGKELPKMLPADSGLKFADLTSGEGREAKQGDRITVHYVGTFPDGRIFDSSRRRDAPYSFRLGNREVIAGWDLGIVGMKVGGKRRLEVPAPLAYGSEGHGTTIPPDAALVFEVELLKIE